MGMRIVVAADIAGYDYKEILKQDLQSDERVDEVIDAGVNAGEDIDYPNVAYEAAKLIAEGKADRGSRDRQKDSSPPRHTGESRVYRAMVSRHCRLCALS